MEQNLPNPFNPITKIKFTIPNVVSIFSLRTTLKVYDVLRNEVALLVNKQKPAGAHEVEFDGSNLSSGIYFYRLEVGSFIQTKKIILLK